MGEGVGREFGMDMSTLLYLTQITNKDLLYSTWNSAQCYGAAWRGEEFGEEWIHVYVRLFFFFIIYIFIKCNIKNYDVLISCIFFYIVVDFVIH